MGYKRPIPVKKEDIKVGNKYFACSYCGPIGVTVLKIFMDTDCVLVQTGGKKVKPFVRQREFIFNNVVMARAAGRDWEHEERKRKASAKNNKIKLKVKNIDSQ